MSLPRWNVILALVLLVAFVVPAVVLGLMLAPWFFLIMLGLMLLPLLFIRPASAT